MGDTLVRYNEKKMILKFQIAGGFAGQLSILKQGPAPSSLTCGWLNKKYFGKGHASAISNDLPAVSTFTFSNIDKQHAQILQSIETDIAVEIEGVIGGLLDGRIALHKGGNTIKDCPTDSHDLCDNLPVGLKIINTDTKEVLATYFAIR